MTAVRPEGRYQSGADPYGGAQQYGGAQPYDAPSYGVGSPHPQEHPVQSASEDGWGVYEQAEQPVEGGPEYPWLPDQTLQLRLPVDGAEPVTEPAPPTGGRAERRRAAQGRTSVRAGGGRRRAKGRGAGGPRPKESAAVVAARFVGELCITLGVVMLLFVAYQLWWTNVQADEAASGGRRRAKGRGAGGPRPKESAAVVAARFVGELCITLGVVMLLFVAYQLWWTNVQADEAASGARNQLEQQWDAQPPGAGQPAPDPNKPEVFEPGKGFAIIYLPKLGLKFPIAEGTSKSAVLDKGLVGHYTGTAMPGDQSGNFALAAHRNTHGEPFRYINELGKGDKVVVETAFGYYTYELTGGIPQTSPNNVSVIKPVPNGSGYTGPGRYITLTTCTPEFTSKFRLILFGKLVEERPRSQGKPAAITGG